MDITMEKNTFFSRETCNNETAWRLTDAISVIKHMGSEGNIILGGDILDEGLQYTYDSWYYNIDKLKSLESNSVDSVRVATEYISDYIKNNGDGFYVIIVEK